MGFSPKILRLNIKKNLEWFVQFWVVLTFGFDPGTDVFRFCCVFWYQSDSMTNGTGNGS